MAGAAAAAASSPDAPPVPVPAPVTVQINHLKFAYPGIDGAPPPGAKPLIQDFNLTLRAGHRCLLVGANGAGKTTLLKILGGKHMVDPDMVRVLVEERCRICRL